MVGAAFHTGQSNQNVSTPNEFIVAVTRKFGFLSWDLAADHNNRKATSYYTESEDSFSKNWAKSYNSTEIPQPHWMWLNPPFSKIGPWAEKCYRESQEGAKILFLVPASVGSNWFRDYVWSHSFVWFLNPRMSFDNKYPYPKDLILCEYNRENTIISEGGDVWKWK